VTCQGMVGFEGGAGQRRLDFLERRFCLLTMIFESGDWWMRQQNSRTDRDAKCSANLIELYLLYEQTADVRLYSFKDPI